MELFSFEDVYYGYDPKYPVLKGISFKIKEKKRTAIVGPNGAGKSTMLFHLNGLYAQQKGTIRFKNEAVEKKLRRELVKHVGIVFQDPDDQILSLTVKDDIGFGPAQLKVDKQEIERRVQDYLKLLNIEHLSEKNPADLSYGQKKQVTIAGVLAMESEVVILDEPMAFLDPKGKENMFKILHLLEEQGKTIIVTTHDMQFVAEWAEEVVVLKNGTCLGTFTPSQLFMNSEILFAANLSLPPIVELMQSIWTVSDETMPTRLHEATKWIKNRI